MTQQTPSNMNTLRLLCFALSAGMLTFAAISIVLVVEGHMKPARGQGLGQAPVSLAIAFAIGVGGLVAWTVVRAGAERAARGVWERPGDVETKERSIWAKYSTLVIMRAAFAESFGLFGIVAFLIGGHWWGLAAPIAAIGIILAGLPSHAKYEQFLARITSAR